MRLPLRIAVIGGNRGQSFADSAALQPDKIRLAALCDLNPQVLDAWRAKSDVRLFDDYQKVLEDPDIDAVCIATPIKLHARQSIAALEAGKHVLCEVTAAWTLDECRDLVAAVRKSGLTYMMAENCCFFRHVLMVQEMVNRGVFGELVQAEGDYIHSLPELLFNERGDLSWRGQLYRDEMCNVYPTHALGPVCQWLGVGREDRLQSMATWQSGAHSCADYVRRMRGADDPLADESKWRLPDTTSTMIRTENGVLVEHRLDFITARPANHNRYSLQGTRAAFTSNMTMHQEPLIWIEGRSPTTATGVARSWEPLYQYADEFEHPLWREWGDEAQKYGHDGGDYFTLREFAAAIIEGRPPCIDVYDAVTWSSITPLSALSLQNHNAAVTVPDFKREQADAELS